LGIAIGAIHGFLLSCTIGALEILGTRTRLGRMIEQTPFLATLTLKGLVYGSVIGGLMIVLVGSIAAMGGRIWMENRVDFSNPRNLITVAVVLTAGAGDLTLEVGAFVMGGIGTATFGAIVLYQILGRSSATK